MWLMEQQKVEEKQLFIKRHSISVRPYQLKVGFLARYIYIYTKINVKGQSVIF